jgi:hypothetical protein
MYVDIGGGGMAVTTTIRPGMGEHMNLELIEVEHEYMTRFSADHTVQGAHITLRRIVRDTDTGEVISDTETPPIPVGSAAGMMPLETALGLHGAALAVAEEIERGRRQQAETDRDVAHEARVAALAERNAARSERDEAQASWVAANAELTQERQRRIAAEAERDELRRQPRGTAQGRDATPTA